MLARHPRLRAALVFAWIVAFLAQSQAAFAESKSGKKRVWQGFSLGVGVGLALAAAFQGVVSTEKALRKNYDTSDHRGHVANAIHDKFEHKHLEDVKLYEQSFGEISDSDYRAGMRKFALPWHLETQLARVRAGIQDASARGKEVRLFWLGDSNAPFYRGREDLYEMHLRAIAREVKAVRARGGYAFLIEGGDRVRSATKGSTLDWFTKYSGFWDSMQEEEGMAPVDTLFMRGNHDHPGGHELRPNGLPPDLEFVGNGEFELSFNGHQIIALDNGTGNLASGAMPGDLPAMERATRARLARLSRDLSREVGMDGVPIEHRIVAMHMPIAHEYPLIIAADFAPVTDIHHDFGPEDGASEVMRLAASAGATLLSGHAHHLAVADKEVVVKDVDGRERRVVVRHIVSGGGGSLGFPGPGPRSERPHALEFDLSRGSQEEVFVHQLTKNDAGHERLPLFDTGRWRKNGVFRGPAPATLVEANGHARKGTAYLRQLPKILRFMKQNATDQYPHPKQARISNRQRSAGAALLRARTAEAK